MRPNPSATILIMAIVCSSLYSQSKFTISGTVTDAHSGEALIGATIYVKNLKTGAISNNYGFFSLSLNEADNLIIAITYVGYEPQAKRVVLNQDLDLNLQLVPGNYSLDEVVIQATPQNANVEQIQMSVIDIPVKKMTELPVILGEPDVLKVVQLLPGVQSGNEGTAGFYVRGGKADQNLVQLDEATVYNPNHLLGILSTFNPRALNSVRLIKGGFPAQYGGRLSSILDVTMKEGNNREFHAEGGIGYITTHLTLEGPIKKEKASFMISGRRTWIDLLIQPFLPPGNKSNYDFYDLNAKVNWKPTKRDRLFLSVFNGRDDAEYRVAQGINYQIGFGNSTATLRWNHIFSPKLFANTSFIYNKYDQDILAVQDKFLSQTVTAINDLNGKLEFQYFPNPNHTVMFGGHYIYHKFLTGGKSESQATSGPGINQNEIPARYFDEFAVYVNDEIKLSNRFSTSLGVRIPGYVSDNTSYYRFEPRASLKMTTGSTSSIKASYTIMNQFMHLVPSATATIPTDVWYHQQFVPSLNNPNKSLWAISAISTAIL